MDDQSADELLGRSISLIDHGIENLNDLTFPLELLHINLHCNCIRKIVNLKDLVNLRSLDLSSNEIRLIQGLESLVNLQVLNLASNQIEVVSGLGSLRKLEKLNLSYNEISDLTGLKDFRRNTHALKVIEIHGNKLRSLKHVTECIANCGTLEDVTLEQNGDSNPVCNVPAYRPTLFAQLPKLQILDGKDKHGHISTLSNIELLHPGLGEYLQWLVESNHSESSATEKSEEHFDLRTPKIDEVLQRFKSKEEVMHAKERREEQDIFGEQPSEKNHLTERLGSLEKQIETLLSLQMKSQMVPEKDTTSTAQTTSPESAQERIRVSKLPRRKIDLKRNIGVKRRPQTGFSKGSKEAKASSSDDLQKAAKKIRDPKDDEAALMMLKELDEERERRWKAEQATRKLVNTVKEMQEKLTEERRIAESAISASAKLKTAFASEKEQRMALEKSRDEQKVKCDELREELEHYREYEADAKKIIGTLEETSRNSERDRLKVQALKDKQLQEAQFKAAASHREAELMKENEKNLKMRINQLQELLANREQDHKTTLDGMVKIEGKEVKDLIDKEMAKQEGKYAQLIQQYNERIESRNRDYAMLEDEFRTGLQMEANRFAELQDAYTQLNNESSELKRTLHILKQKESKATSLVAELTSMVKEQKGRLDEISKSKQEMQISFKERTSSLESQLDANRKQLSKMEGFKQERDKLIAQLKAQESVIEGLRSERKLWGQELAQQGASLAHDRGRLESQIESLTNEVKHLKQREQESLDGLKIKSKLIEDQTDSIKKLKQEITDRKTELKNVNDRLKEDTKVLENELKEERSNCLELQEAVEALKERKDELKLQLGISEKELEKTKEELRNLKKKWEERSELIGQLEEKVIKMKENFDSKEQKLKEERDSALKSASETRDRLKHCDDSFRRQLDEKQREHELHIRKIVAEKDDEINHAKSKVTQVEDEMRVVLEETVLSKRKFEQKFQQLSKAFAEVQQGLNS